MRKPCPFCGSDQVGVFARAGTGEPYPEADLTMVICSTCSASGPAVKTTHDPRRTAYPDLAAAVVAQELWNRRT